MHTYVFERNIIFFYLISPRSFHVRYSSDFKAGGNIESLDPYVVDETELENKCWKYTWMGPVNDNTNTTQVCDNSPDFDSIPCFEPIGKLNLNRAIGRRENMGVQISR